MTPPTGCAYPRWPSAQTTPATTLPTDMQLRICATVAWSCSPNTLSGLFWNWGACGFSAAIVFAASAASRAKCSLRAASRNVHQTGIDRWPGRTILSSGSRPASRAISRARSWYGSDRSMPCTWLLPPGDATLRLLREAERELHCQESVEPQSPAAQFLAVPQFLGLVPIGNEIDLRFRRGKETFRLEFRSRPLKQKS